LPLMFLTRHWALGPISPRLNEIDFAPSKAFLGKIEDMLYKSLSVAIASSMLISINGCSRTLPATSSQRTFVSPPSAPAGTFSVDADFPGGNIIADCNEGDTIFLRPDQRDSSEWWFYWNFRVRGAGGRTLQFQFTGNDPIGTRGPAVSTDGGHTWSWLGRQAVQDSAFSYTFGRDSKEVQFCFSIPYLEANLQEFLGRYADSPHLTVHELCRTGKGRSVERIHASKINAEPNYRILLTARHHACEMIASYSLEGLLEAVLADTNLGRWFQDNVEVLAVPFVDKDGVEDGDQGKSRRSHDHNRDYLGKSIYPSVQAIRQFVPQWSKGKLTVALDLHCPHISGKYNEVIYIVGSSNPATWQQQKEFAAILESVREGPRFSPELTAEGLPYRAESSLPFGTAWNTAANYGQYKSCSRWAEEQPGVRLATTIEIPYANVGAAVVTAVNARAFGRDLAGALRRYLENSDR